MRNVIALLALIFSCSASAMTCFIPPVEERYRDSTHVALVEVTGARVEESDGLPGGSPFDDELSIVITVDREREEPPLRSVVATIRVLESFKGDAIPTTLVLSDFANTPDVECRAQPQPLKCGSLPAPGVPVSAPARAGLFLYAKDPERLSAFYQSVLGLTAAHRTGEMVVLRSPDLQMIVHAMPPQAAAQVEITRPPQLRDGAAIKFFCTVPSLASAEASAQALGGQVMAEQWRGPGFVVRNACDPEGNIFQVRESVG